MDTKKLPLRQLSLTCKKSSTYIDDNNASNTVKFLRESWEKDLYCDIEIEVESRTFSGHRFVLAMLSEYFRAMFSHGNIGNTLRIDFTDPNIFEEILKFGYTSEIEISSENVEKILVAANFLGIKSIEEYCEIFLIENLNLDNCIELYILADIYCLTNLKLKCREKCCRNLIMLYNGEKFFHLPVNIMESLLKDNKLKVFKFGHDLSPMKMLEREELLFSLTLKYISGHLGAENSENILQLMTLVKLPILSKDFMLKELKSRNNIENKTFILNLIDLADNFRKKKGKSSKISYPENWSIPRLPANFCFELSDRFADGREVGRAQHQEYVTKHLDVHSCIKNIMLQMRLWDNREVLGGFRITYDNGEISEFGLLSKKYVYKEYEMDLKEDEHVKEVKLHSGYMIDSLEFRTNQGNRYGPYGGDGGGRRHVLPRHPDSYLFAFECAKVKTQNCTGIVELGFKWINFS